MQWQKPEMREVSLAMEVTAYVNVDAPCTKHVARNEQEANETLELSTTV